MKWRLGKLARNTSLLTLGMVIRAFSQGLVFIIIARSMGADGYGGFVSLIAIAGMLSGLVGFGSHVLLTRDTALDPQKFHQAWGHTLFSLAISSPIIFITYLLLAFFILPNEISWMPILFIGTADLIFWPLSNVCVSAYQGFERMGRVSRMMIAPVVMRLLAVFIFLFLLINKNTQHSMLLIWTSLYLIAAIAAASYTQWMVYKDLGKPVFLNNHWIVRIKESMPFALWASSDKLYIDADKVMLARMISLDVTGIYSAAYRIIEILFIPIHSLLKAIAPKLYQIAKTGTVSQVTLHTVKLMKLPFIYAISSSLLIFLFSDLIIKLLGKEYEGSIDILKLLAWMPIVILPRLVSQHILATSGLQKKGMWIIAFGAITNIMGNLLLIPLLDWKGSVISTYLSEIFMSISMVIIITKSNTKKQLC